MSELDEAKELLMTITKRTHSSILDESIISAIRLLLSDYIDRKAKHEADRLALL